MAIVRWGGTTFSAEPVRQLPNGNWIMRATSHGARWSPGSELEVSQSEIVEMAAAEQPVPATLASLDAAMAQERESLPPVGTLLKGVQTISASGNENESGTGASKLPQNPPQMLAPLKAESGKSVADPTQAPMPAPSSTTT